MAGTRAVDTGRDVSVAGTPIAAAAAMCCRLVPLHDAKEALYIIPSVGDVTLGRKPSNTIVCGGATLPSSVSGVHCIVRQKAGQAHCLEVEDSSTNGTYINDRKLEKGQKARLQDGDVLTLAKQPQERVEYRIEVAPASEASAAQVLGAATPVRGGGLAPMKTTAEGFAREMLFQEQQSKALISAELLTVRRKLDEERVRAEAVRSELRSIRTQVETERSRRSTAQELHDKLQIELEELRKDQKELEELEGAHTTLQGKHDEMEVELGAQQQRLSVLDAAKERLEVDLEQEKGATSQMEEQLAEVQARLQQAQDRAEAMHANNQEARREAEAAKQLVETHQAELTNERSAREILEEKAKHLLVEAERAAKGGCTAQEALAAAEAQHADLEGRIAAHKADTDSARADSRRAQQHLSREAEEAARLCSGAAAFADALRRVADDWARGLPSALGDAAADCGLSSTSALLAPVAAGAQAGEGLEEGAVPPTARLVEPAKAAGHEVEGTAVVATFEPPSPECPNTPNLEEQRADLDEDLAHTPRQERAADNNEHTPKLDVQEKTPVVERTAPVVSAGNPTAASPELIPPEAGGVRSSRGRRTSMATTVICMFPNS
eukprot:TRINITY_DN25028_c0_g1_i3.p1 TRINITY_DN25028_c0_g1~~TRINITY_DN25028_c0_g1_i3.p1  ORF type:complete len:610 (+),score=171.39 TRINITY_DN25028_c0_g1_i3:93-1922(+)